MTHTEQQQAGSIQITLSVTITITCDEYPNYTTDEAVDAISQAVSNHVEEAAAKIGCIRVNGIPCPMGIDEVSLEDIEIH